MRLGRGAEFVVVVADSGIRRRPFIAADEPSSSIDLLSIVDYENNSGL